MTTGKRMTFVISIVIMIMLLMSLLTVSYASDTFKLKGASLPVEIQEGDGFTIKGTVSCSSKLKSVKAGVVCDGKWLKNHYAVKKTSDKSTGIKDLTASMNFRILSKGTYHFKVVAYSSKGSKVLADRKFKVVEHSSAGTADFVPLENYAQGEAFSLKGTVISTYEIKSADISILKDGKVQKDHSTTVYPKKTTIKLSGVSKKINIPGLTKGQYEIRVKIKDSKGKSLEALRSSFTVKAPSSIVISDTDYPKTTLKPGTGYTIKGAIKSTYKMESVTAGITTSKGTWVKNHYIKKNLSASEYQISALNDDIDIAGLSDGTYKVRIEAVDTRGYSKVLLDKELVISSVVSSFSVSSYTYPAILAKSSCFSLRGTIKSAVEIDSAKAYVIDKNGNECTSYTVKNVKAKSLDIRNTFDKYIGFGKLGIGQYTYKVYVKDVNGGSKTVISKKFAVIKSINPDSDRKTSKLSKAMKDKINDGSLFIKQVPGEGGCTVCSAGMMAKRMLVLSGISITTANYLNETNMRADPKVWLTGTGLYNNAVIAGIQLRYAAFPSSYSDKRKKLISLIEDHPEGVAIYGNYNGRYHTVLLTDYEDGTFYVVDPVYGYKVKMAESTLYSPLQTQKSKIKRLYNYWYIP